MNNMEVDLIFLNLSECLFSPKGLLGAAIAIDVTFILSSASSGGASSLPLPSSPQRSARWPAAHAARVGLRGPGRGQQRTEPLLPPLLSSICYLTRDKSDLSKANQIL